MKNSIVSLCLATSCLLQITGCADQEASLPYSGPYLGQEFPGSKPQIFLPGLITTNHINHCIAFLDAGQVCVYSISGKGTFYMYERNGRWTRPQEVPWQNDQGTTDFNAGPDDRTIYFQSARPTSAGDQKQEGNIWTVEWTGDGWTEPAPLPGPPNTEEHWELYPSGAPDGSVYFFALSRPDSRDGDIYRAPYIQGKGYLEAERFEEPINSDYYEVDPIVAPDGSYILFGSGRPGGFGLLDLYVSFRGDDGRWTHPFNAGPVLNPFSVPIRMSITPDGKYFFFPSVQPTTAAKGERVESSSIERWGDADIYWISTDFVNELKRRYVNTKCAADVVRKEYLRSGLDRAAALLRDLYRKEKSEYHFELSEFLTLSGEMIAEKDLEDADKLYETLLAVFPDEARIRLGYSVCCIMNERASYGLRLMKEYWSRFPDRKSKDLEIVAFQLRRRARKQDELELRQFVADEFPDLPNTHYYLAEAYSYYGERERAIEHCRAALKLRPDYEDAAALLEELQSERTDESDSAE